jgi:hypothetical protein
MCVDFERRWMDAMDRKEQLVLAWREEAQALFKAGVSARERADRVIGVGMTGAAAASGVGVANDFVEVLLGVPTVLALLLTYQFSLYADLVAFGTARSRVEAALAARLREEALVAESVGPSRHANRNVSIVLAQALFLILTVGAAVAGGFIAVQDGLRTSLLYFPLTATSAATALVGVCPMKCVWSW